MSCTDSKKSKKRKSCNSGNMGDVLGKECGDGEKGDLPQEIHREEVREEADGAPSADEQSSQCSDDAENFNIKRIEELLAEDITNYGIELPNSTSENTVSSTLSEQGKPCTCDTCKSRRQVTADHDEELQRLTSYWMEIRLFILKVYHSSLKSRVPHQEDDNGAKFKDLVHKLCDRDAHQLFQRLERLVQDFVLEAKNQLLLLITREKQTSELAGSFITGLLDRYDSFCWAAIQLAPYLHELETEYLKQFDISWELFNKHMYLSCVYVDPNIQDNLPLYIAELRNMLPGKNDVYCALVHRYLAFDDEMTLVGAMWRDVETSFIKYNQVQAAFRAKQLSLRQDWEQFKAQRKLEQEKMWNKRELRDFDKRLMSLATLRLRDDGATKSEGFCGGCSSHRSCPCDECSLTHLLTCASIITPPDSPGAVPDKTCISEFRVEAEGSEKPALSAIAIKSVDVEGQSPSCECHICTGPMMTSLEIMERYECHSCVQPPTTGFHLYPHIHGTSGSDSGGLYPHLYNVHPSLLTQLGPKHPPASSPKVAPLLPPQQQKQCKQIVDGIVATIASALPKGVIPCSEHGSSAATQTSPGKGKPAAAPRPMSSKRVLHPHHHHAPATAAVRHSTTQTHTHTCKSMPDVVKSTAGQRAANHKAGHMCHKSHEPIKRVACADFADGDGGDMEDSSSQDDTCSERSSSTTASTQRDSRHCDCCYCEVFGHGVPSVAPVSRNYQEMRERLRLLLTKKKAKCKVNLGTAAAATGKPVPAQNGTTPQTATGDSVPKVRVPGPKSKTMPGEPVPVAAPTLTKHGSLESLLQQPVKDARDLEALLDFIEGNQSKKCKDSKKAAKRLKQKQKKQEEKDKKDEEEAERERIEAIRTKNPEVTITMVNSPETQVPVVPNQKSGKAGKNAKKAESKTPAQASSNAPEAVPGGAPTKVVPIAVTGPQMVTIKRVMESSSTEPTVTITLKGATPDKDKVLFTLVHGGQERYDLPYQNVRYAQDTAQPGKQVNNQKPKGNARETSNSQQDPASNAKNFTAATASGKKGKKEKGKANNEIKAAPHPNKRSEHSTASVPVKPNNGTKAGKTHTQKATPLPNNSSPVIKEPVAANRQPANQTTAHPKAVHNPTPSNNMPPSNSGANTRALNFDNFRLPPGITITKVDGPTPIRRPQPKAPEPVKSHAMQDSSYSTTIIAAPTNGSSSNHSSEYDRGMNGSVIVVDTGRMKEELKIGATNGKYEEEMQSNRKKKNKKKNKNGINQEVHNGTNGNRTLPRFQQNDNVVTINKVPNKGPPQQSQAQFQNYTPNTSQAAIIKVNGSMVTIRNPAFHPPMTDGNRYQQPPMNGRAEVVDNSDFNSKKPPKKPTVAAGSSVKGKENYVTPPRFANAEATLRNRLAGQVDYSGLNGVSITKVSPPCHDERGNATPPRMRHQQFPAAKVIPQNYYSADDQTMAASMAAANDATKKKKKKKMPSGQSSSSEPDLVDNVFAPKDIDLENGDIDDDDVVVEKFKRFCFYSSVPEQKEKVHLNIKDLVIKKKGSAIGCS